MAPGARLAIIERVLPELGQETSGGDPANFLADMQMMALNTGRERSATEFEKMLSATGFEPRGIRMARSAFRVVEASAAT